MNTHYLHQLPEAWEHKARIFAALGDGTRQKILLLFEAGETITLKTLAEILPLSRSAVVHHITVLEQAGLLLARRQGREVGYTLNTDPLITSLEDALDYARQLSGTPRAALGEVPDAGLGASTAGLGDVAVVPFAGTRSQTEHLGANSPARARFVPLSPQELAHD